MTNLEKQLIEMIKSIEKKLETIDKEIGILFHAVNEIDIRADISRLKKDE